MPHWRDIDAAKANAARGDNARVEGLPPGFISGLRLEIAGNTFNVNIQPGVANVRGTKVVLGEAYGVLYPDDWHCTRAAGEVFYYYISTNKKFHVYPHAPAWNSTHLGWYHPNYAYRYLGKAITAADNTITYVVNQGSISAEDIDVDVIASRMIAAGEITADTINTGAITAEKISNDVITYEHLNMGSLPRLLETGLTHHFPCQEGGGAVLMDVKGGVADVALAGDYTWVGGHSGAALHVKNASGDGGYATLLATGEADALGNEWSLSLWAYSDVDDDAGDNLARILTRDASDYWAIVCDQDTGGSTQVWTLYCAGTDRTISLSAKGWHHFVGVFDEAANTIDWYVDAEAQTQVTDYVNIGSSRPVVLGVNVEAGPVPGDNDFEGYVEAVRFYSRKLTEPEIHALYARPAGNPPSIVSTSQINNLAITSEKIDLLAVKEDQIDGEAVTTAKVDGLAITASKIALAALDATHINPADWEKAPSDANLVAYYPLDDESAADGRYIRDVSGNGRTLTVNSTALATGAGKHGPALHFDAASYLLATGLSITSTNWSLCAWVNPDNLSSDLERVLVLSKSDDTEYHKILQDADSEKFYGIFDDGTDEDNVISDSPQANGTWYFVCITTDGTTGYLYIDGVKQDDSKDTTDQGEITVNKISIGARSTGANPFDGWISQIRIYSEALTEAEVQWLFHNPHGLIAKTSVRASYGSFDARHMIFTGDDVMEIENDEYITAAQELFVKNFNCRSTDGHVPNRKSLVFEPAELEDNEGNTVTNPLTKTWAGIPGTVPTQVVGAFRRYTNRVESPEDLTTADWVETNSGDAALSDYLFDGYAFTRITNGAALRGYVRQDIAADVLAVTEFMYILMRRPPEETGSGWFRLRDGASNRIVVTVSFVGGTVTTTTGTNLDGANGLWLIANELVMIRVKSSTITTTNTHVLDIGTNSSTSGHLVEASCVMLVNAPSAFPYTTQFRPNGFLSYPYSWQAEGSVAFYFRPNFEVDIYPNKWIVSDFDSLVAASGNNWNIQMSYNVGANLYRIQIRGASRTATVDIGYDGTWGNGTAFDTDSELQQWTYCKIAWQGSSPYLSVTMGFAGGALTTVTDTTVTGTITFNKNLSLGSIPLYASPNDSTSDCYFTDVVISSAYEVSETHFDAAKPYRDGTEIGNKKQTFAVDRYGASFQRSDISMIDSHRRIIDIGSQGLKARDRSGSIIHDIPNVPSLLKMAYLGHPIMYEAPAELDSVVLTYSGTNTSYSDTSLVNVDLSGEDWIKNIPNIYGIIVLGCIDYSINGGKVAAGSGFNALIRYSTQYNTSPDSWSHLVQFKIVADAAGNARGDAMSAQGFMPVIWEAGIPYVTYEAYCSFYSMDTNNAGAGVHCKIALLGFMS